MGTSWSTLARFVCAVHRRHVALRFVERAALGLLGGAVVAAALVAVLLWRRQDAWAVAGAALALGALAGAVWGITQRPTPLASAMEADRQLRTADLLATAWVVRGRNPSHAADAFEGAVLAVAAARCAVLSPSSVLLHRLGVRAWGGIALAVAFVGTLAALSAGAPEAGAMSPDAVALANGAAHARVIRPILDTAGDDHRQPRRVDRGPADDRAFADESPKPGADETRDPVDPSKPGRPRQTVDQSSPGIGDGDGRSSPPDPTGRGPQLSPRTQHGEVRPLQAVGQAQGGTGRAAHDPSAGDGAGGVRTQDGRPNRTSPWTYPAWPAAAEAAIRAVEAGRIADDYRDLVRGYFDPSISPIPTP